MPRNIVIYSDGTGQRGGLYFDERRTNVYKMYRATRAGPDSSIDAIKQIAFYDAGIGSRPGSIDSIAGIGRGIFKYLSQATGLGIDKNIIDCYSAILRLYRPGDRIFLIGFSRGAYTVRGLSGVLALCGIPRKSAGGALLNYSDGKLRRIATEAVKGVYGYTSSVDPKLATDRQIELNRQRSLLAEHFRKKYDCGRPGSLRGHPYFVGVFDTVASVGEMTSLIIAALMVLGVIAAFAGLLTLVGSDFITAFLSLLMMGAATAFLLLLVPRVRWLRNLPGVKWWKSIHLTEPRRRFNDVGLNPCVHYARHAIAIDERRHAFQRVPWGKPGVWFKRRHTWFKQVWFAGNHSDIGGSYPENESRLSDIALKWMADEAEKVGLKLDRNYLRPSPDPLGEQHDEAKGFLFRFAPKLEREPKTDAPLHPSVIKRFEAPAVLQCDRFAPYLPEGLRKHVLTKGFYATGAAAKPVKKAVPKFSEKDWAKKAADGTATKGIAKLDRTIPGEAAADKS